MQKSFFILVLLSLFGAIAAAESINKIMVIVGKIPITAIDYRDAKFKYSKIRKFIPEVKKNGSEKTRILNFLIDRAIIDLVSEQESIQVDEKRVESEIQRRMGLMEIEDEKIFSDTITKQTGIPYDLWVSEIPYQIKKSQLLQVKITTPLPSEAEIQKWYNQNRRKVGFEVRFREIIMVPRNRDISEEARIFNEIQNIRKQITDRSSFLKTAYSHSNQSMYRPAGGLIDYIAAYDLYKKSKIYASVTSQMRNGEISEVFKDERGRYCILLLEGKRPTPLEQVRRGIQNVLYREKEEDAFLGWLVQMRSDLSIKYYDNAYKKENNIKKQSEEYEYEE